MGKRIVTKFTIPQRGGKDPDIVVTRTQFFPGPRQRTKQIIMKQPLTKKQFEQLLRKSAQPLPKQESAPKGKQTLEPHPSDGYSDKRKSQGKTEDKEG